MRITTIAFLVLGMLIPNAPTAAQSDSLRLYPDGVPGAKPSDVSETT